jgi:hypothetical protein
MLIGLSSDGTWILKPQEKRGRCKYWNWKNREKRHITIQKSTKKEPRDDMTRGSRKSLHPEIRYYFLILGSNYSGMENFEANGKDHLQW